MFRFGFKDHLAYYVVFQSIPVLFVLRGFREHSQLEKEYERCHKINFMAFYIIFFVLFL